MPPFEEMTAVKLVLKATGGIGQFALVQAKANKKNDLPRTIKFNLNHEQPRVRIGSSKAQCEIVIPGIDDVCCEIALEGPNNDKLFFRDLRSTGSNDEIITRTPRELPADSKIRLPNGLIFSLKIAATNTDQLLHFYQVYDEGIKARTMVKNSGDKNGVISFDLAKHKAIKALLKGQPYDKRANLKLEHISLSVKKGYTNLLTLIDAAFKGYLPREDFLTIVGEAGITPNALEESKTYFSRKYLEDFDERICPMLDTAKEVVDDIATIKSYNSCISFI